MTITQNGDAAQVEYTAGQASNTNGSTNGHHSRHHDSYTTRAIHVGSEPDPSTGAVVPSLSVATTFLQDGIGKDRGYDYSRSINPTRSALEAVLTSLETSPASSTTSNGQHDQHDGSGGDSLVFASGSAATAAISHWVSLPTVEGGAGGKDGENGVGGHILAVNDVYGGTARYLSRASRASGLEVTYLDMEKAGEQGIRDAIRPDTRVIWIEVPTNPLLLVPPLGLVAKIVDSLPAGQRPLVLVDTTFLSSFYFTPLVAQGGEGSLPLADIVLSSLSKYSGGHSDIILGSLTISARTKAHFPNLLKGLRFLQNSMGGIPSPRDCHLMIRSLKTLSVRALRHGINALRFAAWLREEKGDVVERIRYPGLKTDAAFHQVESLLSGNAKKELAFLGWQFPSKKNAADESVDRNSLSYATTLGIPFGGVVSFEIKGASEEETEKFLVKLRLISLAESLGGVESLIEAPYGMTHQGLPAETRAALGITPGLIRFSVGIEDFEDLVDDIEQAFKSIGR